MRLCLMLLLALAACAAPRRSDPPAIAAGAGQATILASRPIIPAATVLAIIGTAPGTSRVAVGSRREFILRTGAGKIISIVADDDGRWRTGRAVLVTGGDQAGGGQAGLAQPDS